MSQENLVLDDVVAEELLGDATYSPEDDKLRLYPEDRLPAETYERVKAAGFKWAPRQELFFAKWSPSREDLLVSLAGTVGDEDKSLLERAEERAGRFGGYEDNRRRDAEAASDSAGSVAKRFEFGQPILVGHHSEKKARRDKSRMEDATRRAVSMWSTAEYWSARAAGAIRAARYRLSPAVRARRIKKIEAEVRKYRRAFTPRHPGEQIMQRRWHCPVCRAYDCKEHPEAQVKIPHVYCGAARGGSWVAVEDLPAIERHYSRWIAHAEQRLAYEKAMLASEGRSDLLAKKPRPKLPPLLNYRAETILYENPFHAETIAVEQLELTRAQYKRIPADQRSTRMVQGTHRVRMATQYWAREVLGLPRTGGGFGNVAVFLTDSKVHPVPEAVDA